MKQCPKCNRGYLDESLNFCLDDGSWLVDGTASLEEQTQILTAGTGIPDSQTRIFGVTSSFDMAWKLGGKTLP